MSPRCLTCLPRNGPTVRAPRKLLQINAQSFKHMPLSVDSPCAFGLADRKRVGLLRKEIADEAPAVEPSWGSPL